MGRYEKGSSEPFFFGSINSIMIPFTPTAVANCFGTVVADVNAMNNFGVNTWVKSTFPEVAQIASQNPSLFTSLASSGITIIPTKPNTNFSRDRDSKTLRTRVDNYNSTISKIKVAFAVDLKSAMACAGYSPGQIQKAVDAFNKLLPAARLDK